MTPIDPLAVAARVARALEREGIRYVIGGSVASSLHGEPRSTLDVDIMIAATEEQARRVAVAIGDEFYSDPDDAAASVRAGRPFNVIHLGSSLKVDLFPVDEIGEDQLGRGQALIVRADLEPLRFYAVEDLIVRKLLWFRAGGEVSARQWGDVISLLKARRFDADALLREVNRAKIGDLLQRAAVDAGVEIDVR